MNLSIPSLVVAALAAALAGCGGGQTAPASPAPAPGAAATEAKPAGQASKPDAHHAKHDFPPAVTAFHDLMAPKWHAKPGDARQKDTCGAVSAFEGAAKKIGSDPVPAKAAAREGSWHNAVADLNIAINGVRSACAAEGRPNFHDAFKDLHNAFHRLVALIGHKEHDHAGGKHDHAGGKHDHAGGKHDHAGGKHDHAGGKHHH